MVATDVKRRKNDQCPRKTFEDANFGLMRKNHAYGWIPELCWWGRVD